MFLVTGPVTTSASAWRGDATTRTPKRSASYTGPNAAANSASHALHDPESTWRTCSDPRNGAAAGKGTGSGADDGPGSVARPNRAIRRISFSIVSPSGQPTEPRTRTHRPT